MSTFKRPLPPSTSSTTALRRRPAGPPHLTSATGVASHASNSLVSPPLSASSRSRDPSESRAIKREPTDANIQVVVRCRGLAPAEDAAGVPVVARVKATRGTEVKLVDPSPVVPSSSSSNLVAARAAVAPTATAAQTASVSKTWDFGDRTPEGENEPRGTVYGPDADQGMLYNDVAKPILQQVLQGYNCTIFAYGQTGTGKTYTMEGNLSPYHGTFHPDAGVIPRTLYSLFDRLVESKCEYSVRCSYIELYNEELRDLNAADSSLSSSSSTSSDSVAPSPEPGATSMTGPKALRIYEETKNGSTGVVIQGLEETVIQSAEDGLRVLRRGSERRQIAATNCNERSSRSHSIFTINVQVRDSSKEGPDVLKVGKLNLVDLAGSENVGRSGATNSRAREAGMINASLLALGRVINQLVDKSDSNKKQHIAYRESKLTRLLQDSLGGRTKTTIIATISPVSYEETASTLTYAHQAKSIQNRPEVNQRVSRNVVLNQFATEIARLQADLQAARGHEGVYVSKETWDSLEVGRHNYDDVKQRLEIAESQLQTTRDQFEQNFRLLSTREDQLRKAQEELAQVKTELSSTRADLAETKMTLAEQEVLRDAYESSREGWKTAAGDALSDVEGLRAKLARKADVEQANAVTVAEAQQAITQRTAAIDERAKRLRDLHGQFTSAIAGELDAFTQRQHSQCASSREIVDAYVEELTDYFVALSSAQAAAKNQAGAFHEVVAETSERLYKKIRSASEEVESQQKVQIGALMAKLSSYHAETSAALQDLALPAQQLRTDCETLIDRNQHLLASLRSSDADHLAAENARLHTIVEDLQTLLRAEEAQAELEQATLLDRMRLEIAAMSGRRQQVLASTVARVEQEVVDIVDVNDCNATTRAERLAEVECAEQELKARMSSVAVAAAGSAAQADQASTRSLQRTRSAANALWQTGYDARQIQASMLSAAASQVRRAEIAYERESRTSVREGREATRSLLHTTGAILADWRQSATTADSDAHETVLRAAAEVDAFDGASAQQLVRVEQDAQDAASLMREAAIGRFRRDLATGTTPAPRDRPQDRLAHLVDLDAEQPTVLERLLAVRAEAVNAEAALRHADASLADLGTDSAPTDKRLSMAVRETPSPVVMRVPLPRHERPSMVTAVGGGGKDGLKRERVKPAPLGERDHNNPARRLTATTRRMAKPAPKSSLA